MAKRSTPESKTAVAYCRVSTDEQSLSVEAQKATLASWCTTHGYTLVACFEDVGVSGGAALDKRPGLLAALDALTPGSVLVAVKRDRLARDAMVASMIERLAERGKARVLTCDGIGNDNTPEGKLMRGMIDLFAEYERQIIKARTRTALAHKRAKGEKTGGDVPYGYTVAADGKTLVEDASEQELLATVRQHHANGLSLRAIATELTRQGYLTRKGTPFHFTQVARLLKDAA